MRRAAVFAFVIVVVSMVFLLAPQPGQAGNVGVGVSVWLPPPPVIVVRPPAVVYGPPAVYGYQPYGYSDYGHAPRYYRDHGYERHRHRDWNHRDWRHRDWRHNHRRDVPPPAHGGGWRRKHGGWND